MGDMTQARQHKLIVDNRDKCCLTGVREVCSFEAELVVLATEQGRLTIKGQNMHMIRLDVDKGELDFDGNVISFTYSDIKTPGTVSAGIIKRLFK